jgi:hypothetical protein
MAFSLSSISKAVNTGLNDFSKSLNSEFTNGLNSSLRNANSIGSQLNSRIASMQLQTTGIDSLTNQLNSTLAGGNISSTFNKLSGSLNQTLANGKLNSNLLAGEVNASFNKVSSALGNFPDLSINPNKISTALNQKLGNLGFAGIGEAATGIGFNPDTFADSIAAFNPVKIVNSSAQELAGAIGGEFDKAKQYIESISQENDPLSFIGALGGSDGPITITIPGSMGRAAAPGSGSGTSQRLPNPLRNFNSYNYIFTLGILDASQYNNPDSYRNGADFKYFVVKSGGGLRTTGYSSRVKTESELPDKDAEYFIDDVELKSIIAPNTNTGTSMGTNVEFTVVEPYSMGKFIEALLVASQKAGYSNYIDAPFCLRIEFAGWDERGERDITTSIKPYYVPIKLVKTDFEVTSQGSTYRVKSIPYNETGLTDTANQAQVSINAAGSSVHEVLESGKNSVSNILNDRIEELENKNIIKGYDRYLIAFPKDKDGLVNSIRNQNVDLSALRATMKAEEQERIRQGNPSERGLSDADTIETAVPVINTNAPDTYLYLKAYASDINNMNEIGRSLLLEDSRDGAPQPHPDAASVNNAETQTNQRQNNESQVANKARSYQFSQNDKITNIIETVMLNSTYARDVAKEESVNGFKKWFRTEVMTFIDSDKEMECELGRPRRTYVYVVQPYTPHEASTLSAGERPSNVRNLRSLVKKEYNYIYTGKNEDVLNFDINFNQAFFNSLRPDMAQGRESVNQETANSNQQQGSEISRPKAPCNTSDPTGPVELANQQAPSSGGAPKPTAQGTEARIAQMYHDRLLNSNVDMISAELEIWGDPYYLPTDLGNYSARSIDPTINADGGMNYMRNEVYVLVNFKSPLDYQLNGNLMDFPVTVPQFSGLYKVMSTQSNFSGGQFKQTLKMIRMKGQNDESTTNNKTPIVTAPKEKRLDSGGAAANAPSDLAQAQAAQAAAAGSNVAGVVTTNTSNAVTSGPNTVFTQELLMTGDIEEGTKQLLQGKVANVSDFLQSNPELRQFVARSTQGDRTALIRDTATGVFPMNIGFDAGQVDPALAAAANASSEAAQAAAQASFRAREAAIAGVSTAFNQATGTRPPVNRISGPGGNGGV